MIEWIRTSMLSIKNCCLPLPECIGEEGSQATEFSSLTKGSADAYKAYVDATAAFEDAQKEVFFFFFSITLEPRAE